MTLQRAGVQHGLGLRRRDAPRRWLNRAAATAVPALALVALYLFVVRPVLPQSEPVRPVPIDRPASIPTRVPAWAWQLHTWHLTPAAVRGARPAAAPAGVPAWFWDFRRWRLSLAPRE